MPCQWIAKAVLSTGEIHRVCAETPAKAVALLGNAFDDEHADYDLANAVITVTKATPEEALEFA